jgi:phenylpyruvate tautomerase PptA (4-oxalocrotonate tautomerase family)
MPLVRVTYPSGAMPHAQKVLLAKDLTEIVLDAEVDAVTESGRMVTVVQFHESPADDWAVGGTLRSAAEKPPDHFIVDIVVLEALLEGERRSAVHRRVTEAFQRAFGPAADPMLPLRVWVLIHEVREGGWGAAGRTVSALDVAQFINPRLDPALRAQIADGLAARKR